jgi:predicted DNA-binding protein YlxM (UPF0122 family)
MSELNQTNTQQLEEIEKLFEPIPDESQTAEPTAEGDLDEGTEVTEPQETEESEQDEKPVIDYNQIIPLVNGEKITLGELKDRVQAQQKAQTDFIDRENQVMRQYEEIQQLTQQLNIVPPEVVQQAQAKLQENVKQEFQLMLNAIPQWKDAVEFTKGRDAIYDLAKSYGLERDIGKVVDHRVIKMLFDFSRLRGDIQTAKEQVKPIRQASDPKAKPNKPLSKEAQLNQTIAAAKTGGQAAKLAAIDSLIQGR